MRGEELGWNKWEGTNEYRSGAKKHSWETEQVKQNNLFFVKGLSPRWQKGRQVSIQTRGQTKQGKLGETKLRHNHYYILFFTYQRNFPKNPRAFVGTFLHFDFQDQVLLPRFLQLKNLEYLWYCWYGPGAIVVDSAVPQRHKTDQVFAQTVSEQVMYSSWSLDQTKK